MTMTNGAHVHKSVPSALPLVQKLSEDHDLVLKTFRLLIAGLCQQFGGGHSGGAVGMAAIGVFLWKYVMRYAPHTPDFFNRHRFVLSNGEHTCLLQYTFLHLTGYKAMTLEQLESYHLDRVDALCPGHPEIEHEGIEVTTGPLGQGIANAVGLAKATKNLAATYIRPGYDVLDNHTWCMIGDACLREGVGLEAISLAGHFRLNNLTVMYDNNQITCDGSVDLTNTEDVNAKMRASGWNVTDVKDGCFDIAGIVSALEQARASKDKPTFISVHTVIGLDSSVAGTAVAHGAAYGTRSVADIKTLYGFNPEEHFVIGDTVRQFFKELPARGQRYVQEWDQLVRDYKTESPELGAEFQSRVRGELPADWQKYIPSKFPEEPIASRASSGLVFNLIAKRTKTFMPALRTDCNMHGNYSGRYIHWGVREHAMAAISNAVRVGALQQLQIVHVATHDSIGMGEDGPTHQPIELAALYRAMPNLLYIRPGDSEETAGAWIAAINAKKTPSIISTSRQVLPQLTSTRRDGVALGAYVLSESESAVFTLIGVGAELSFAVEVAEKLEAEKDVSARVVSFPCQRPFEQQSLQYKRDTLRRHQGIPAVFFEPYTPNGWERYADASISVTRFGHSLPG
ncbi:uncharacterized protein N7477_002062 [Penicillium maclennaniae]|uniref:uncharacterized protein n=1 Tax=Penicillium maclennaniae TaxID=1343394 RepID=UPI002540FAB7|nr:uncharacterized protein N7477_002062 [Penicillium maclennaniae]KAJ5682122.1 hypothetical protein N7477_002062 [Penicillium maclennaniae]